MLFSKTPRHQYHKIKIENSMYNFISSLERKKADFRNSTTSGIAEVSDYAQPNNPCNIIFPEFIKHQLMLDNHLLIIMYRIELHQ